MKSLTRRAATAALAMVLCTGLAACAPELANRTAEETNMPTPQENRDQLASLFDETQLLVETDWTNKDDSYPLECDTVTGNEGVQYSLGRETTGSPSLDDRKVIADRVAEFWETRGYTTTRSEDPNFGSEAHALNDEHSSLVFSISENAATIRGGSNCTPGSWDDIMDKLLKEEAELQQ